MKCFVEFDCHADIIDIPFPVSIKIRKYRNQFLDWIYDRRNRHKYWKKCDNGKGDSFEGVYFDSDAFVEWLNKRVIKDKYEPAIVVERNLDVNSCPEGMLSIFF